VTRPSAVLARALLIGVGVLLFIIVGEIALRVVFRDAGKATLGGPGGRDFDHETIDGERRGRLDTGPKTPGVPRVMVIGDSITYGLGVHDWRDTWPELLARSLEDAGRPHQFAVLAEPGNDMPQLLKTMRGWVRRVQPDVLIYQWYVNDIEAMSHRPSIEQPWQRLPWHTALQSSSYLYYVLDRRLAQLLTRPEQSYVAYLRNEFRPGSLEWTEFEREFHEFGMLAQVARRRMLMLYPQVPFRDEYPLQILHDRMRHLAGPHELEIPPMAWTRTGGTLVNLDGSRWGQAVRALPDAGILTVQTSDYLLAPGTLDVVLTIADAPPDEPLGVLEIVDLANRAVVTSAAVPGGGGEKVAKHRIRLTLPGDRVRRVVMRLTSSRPDNWALANIAVPLDYGFEVIDLTQTLNTFDTHASTFDAHPNERAHQTMAAAVFAALSPRR
jgi:hypothetical protein